MTRTRADAKRARGAFVGLLVAASACSEATSPPPPEPDLVLASAGAPSVSGGVAASVSISVRVETPTGAPHAGASVAWSTEPGSGSIASAPQSLSDATGHAAALWTLGTQAGAQRATATLVSNGVTHEVTFDATALAGPAASASVVADSVLLSARGETAFLGPTFMDQFGNPTAPGALTWLSRDPAVANVSDAGLITGNDAGSTYVVGSMTQPVDSLLVTVVMRGAITVTFDDGFITAYTNAWPLFQEFGLPGNVAVNPAQVGFAAYMTEAHLDELHAAGWSMVSHTMTHQAMPTLSSGELDFELRVSQAWIEERGYNGGNVFIVPFHDWEARERDAIGGFYEAMRGVSADAVSPDSLVAWRPSNPFELTGIEGDNLPFTTSAGRDRLRTLLQRTVDEGAFLDVFFHHLQTADVDAFRETLRVIDEFRDRVLPYHELYPRFARSVF